MKTNVNKSCLPIARLFVLSTVALTPFLLAEESQARNVGPGGGGGGGEFRILCEPGDQLVGIDTMSTHVIDFIAPVCGNRKTDSLATYGRPSAGAMAGTLRKPRCAPDAVMTILHVFWDNTPLVNRVGFTCWNIKNNKMTHSLPDYGGQIINNRHMVCPQGEIGVGIFGRAGTAIDALGIVCEKWEVADAGGGDQGGGDQGGDQGGGDQGGGDQGGGNQATACGVERAGDIHNAPGGAKIGELPEGQAGVTLVEKSGNNWFHIKWDGAPPKGWVYSGPGYEDAIFCPPRN